MAEVETSPQDESDISIEGVNQSIIASIDDESVPTDKEIESSDKRRFSTAELGSKHTFDDLRNLLKSKGIEGAEAERIVEENRYMTVLDRHYDKLTDDERKECDSLHDKMNVLRRGALSADQRDRLKELSRQQVYDVSWGQSGDTRPGEIANLIEQDERSRN